MNEKATSCFLISRFISSIFETMLKGKKILIGITGSIAAYKTILLVRLLIQEGAEVKVIMTNSAKDFVTPLTLSTLSKQPVLTDISTTDNWANHVMLGRWADLMIIAPLSCNTLAKMANGQCDNLLLAVYLSATCPVVVAPAMDEDMWHHATTKNNLQKLKSFGNTIIPANKGELASGLIGEGRMAEPAEIITFIKKHFFSAKELEGKKALVSAGPTYEAIDPVRFISNHSSGKMGVALAEELQRRGADVVLVAGPGTATPQVKAIKVVPVVSAEDMFNVCQQYFESADITIMAAAVADYTPAMKATEKIKKKDVQLTIELQKTRDILKSLGEKKRQGQVLIGFALETNNEKENAKEKLVRKNADMIVLNSLNDKGAGFAHDTNKVTVLKKDNTEVDIPLQSKTAVAHDILDIIIHTYYA